MAQQAGATTYYVATTGSDSNSGTSASSPFLTLSMAASAATQPGDTVMVANGTYGNEGVVSPGYVVTLYYSGTASAPITFQAQNRGQVILDSMNTSTTETCNGAAAYFNLYNAAYVVIDGFVIQRGCLEGIHSNDSANNITISHNEIRNIGQYYDTEGYGLDGIFLNSSEHDFLFDSNTFHDIGRTGGYNPALDHGIYSEATNVTITNNVFYNTPAGWNIQLINGSQNVVIANNTFAYGNQTYPGLIVIWNQQAGAIENITIRDNIFYNPPGGAAVHTDITSAISGCSFDHNIVAAGSVFDNGSTPCTVGSNMMNTTPTLANPSSYDFHEVSGSSSIDAGIAVSVSSDNHDHDGNARPQGTSYDIGAYEFVAAPAAGPVISAVAATPSSGSATITWSTNVPATSYVQYGLTSAYTSTTAENTTLVSVHSVTLSNLSSSTLYHYRVASHDSSGNLTLSSDNTFTTSAPTISLSASSPSASVTQGNSVTDTITATLVSGSSVTASFTASGLPSGVTATFSSSNCAVTCSTTLTLAASSSAATGAFSVVVTAASSGASASTTIALAVNAAAVTSGTPDYTTGLEAWWKFNEGNPSFYAYDSTANGNTGYLEFAGWANTTPSSLSLNGTTSYVRVNESTSLEATTAMTVAFWMYATSGDYTTTDPRIIEKVYDWDVKLNVFSNTVLYPQFSAGGQYARTGYAVPLNTWQHVAFTFSNGTVNAYVNGQPVAIVENTFTGTGSLPNYAYGLLIGAYDTSGDNLFAGNLSNVRLYNRALAAADIAALYAANPAPPTP